MGTAKSGNRTKGPRLFGNEGNESPMWMRSLPRTSADITDEDRVAGKRPADAVKSQYNAEATYSPWANEQAANHLGALRTHLGALAAAFPHPEVQGLVSRATRAHEAATAKGGFAAHPDILGSTSTDAEGNVSRTRGHIDRISSALRSIADEPGGIPASAQPHFAAAQAAIAGYHKAFTPVGETPFKEFKSDPSRVSLETNKEYYPMNVPANLERTPHESTGGTVFTYDKESGKLNSRVTEGKKTENTPEARAAYSRIAEAKKAEKKAAQKNG